VSSGVRRSGSAIAGISASKHGLPFVSAMVGFAFAAATVVHFGLGAGGASWAAVQLVLAGVAAYDFATRRIPNLVIVPVSLGAVITRAAFERSALLEVVAAGCLAFLLFLALALVLRGGLGMGDVKLAGMLGFLLGHAVLPALVVGTVAGGLTSVVILVSAPSMRGRTIAYGPYLCLGGAVAILLFHPPPLG
jgi:leader peptidase (prepilin peptidase) / N-methyltransferase